MVRAHAERFGNGLRIAVEDNGSVTVDHDCTCCDSTLDDPCCRTAIDGATFRSAVTRLLAALED